jgi:hypothetical protein
MWLAGKTEVLGENLHRRHFVHHKSHLPDPGANPGCRGGKPATNRLSYGAAFSCTYTKILSILIIAFYVTSIVSFCMEKEAVEIRIFNPEILVDMCRKN